MTDHIYRSDEWLKTSIDYIEKEVLEWANKLYTTRNPHLQAKILTFEFAFVPRHSKNPNEDGLHIKYPGPEGQEKTKKNWL